MWRRGSVVASWLLDLTAAALIEDVRSGQVRGPGFRLRRGPVDDQGGHRRGGAGARALGGALPAVQLTRRGGLPGQTALGDAVSVRRPSRKAREVTTHDDLFPFRRTGLLRDHRRTGQQDDFPVTSAPSIGGAVLIDGHLYGSKSSGLFRADFATESRVDRVVGGTGVGLLCRRPPFRDSFPLEVGGPT